LKQGVEEIVEFSVFETTFEAFREWGTDGEGDDYIVGVL